MDWFHLTGVLVAAEFLAAALGISAVVAILVALGYGVLRSTEVERGKSYWETVAGALPFVFLLALVGGLTGQLGGGSREGVVGELLPAVMGLFGPLIAFYLGSKRDKSGQVSVNTLAFLLSFFVMYNVASVWRQDNENWAFCRDLFSNADFDNELEMKTREVYWLGYCKTISKGWTIQDQQPALPDAAAQPAPAQP